MRARIVLGIPGAGKSYRARREALRRGSVVWCSHLRSERERVAAWFRREGRVVHVLPSKPRVCPVAAKLAAMGGGVYAGMPGVCDACPLRETCPYYRELRRAREVLAEGGVVVGSLAHYWLGMDADMLVVDEFDAALDPASLVAPREMVEKAAAAVAAELGSDAADEYMDRYVCKGSVCVARAAGVYSLLPIVRARTYLLSATFNPGGVERIALLPEETRFEVETLPPPDRGDVFVAARQRVYESVARLSEAARRLAASAVARTAAAGRTATLLARSRREAARLHGLLSSRGAPVLAEAVNWERPDQWRMWPVRVLVIGGRFHRSLDIDSDAVYAFYQHPPPGAPEEMERLASVIDTGYAAEIVEYLHAARHVQSLFRAIRDWRRGHAVALLDGSWLEALRRFPHIWSYVEKRLETVASLTEALNTVLHTVTGAGGRR